MPSVTARRKCPELIFVKPRFEVYRDVSGQIVYVGKANDLAKRVSQYFDPNRTDAKTAKPEKPEKPAKK